MAARPDLPEPGANPGIDVVFPVLHGTFGEDGTVQGLLELAGPPYVGAGVLASSVAMDKDVIKRLCRGSRPPDRRVRHRCRGALDADAMSPFSYPVFVKPANLGSSVGISKAQSPEDLDSGARLAAEFDRKLIIERGIVGRELECSVLGNDAPVASLPCEILPSRDFYDYEDKYLLDKAGYPGSRGSARRSYRRNPPARRRLLSGSGMRGHGPRRFPAGERNRQDLRQRDQHHPRLHLDQHVPEDVGGHRAARTPN